MAEPINEQNVETKNEESFKIFKTQQEFDDFCAHLIKKTENSATSKAKKELEQEIRTQIENEAKMSSEEKLKAEREKLMADFKIEKINFNKELAKSKLVNAGFEENELDIYLDFVNEDKDLSLSKIDKICDNRKSAQEKLKAQWTEEIKKNEPSNKISSNDTAIKDFKNMSIKEMTELKNSNPKLYESTFGNN